MIENRKDDLHLNKDKVARVVIESALDQMFKRFHTDPNRSLRSVVDLGVRFSNGRIQKDTFSFVNALLENENSPYYIMASKLLTNTSPYAIKNFGINVGYFGWSKGAKVIRETEAKVGYQIPWALHLDVGQSYDTNLFRRLITEGKALGTYCYLFYVEDPNTDLSELLRLFREEENCGFLLFMPAGWSAEYAARFALCTNLMVFLDARGELIAEEAERLKGLRALYSVYYIYETEEDRDYLRSGQFWELAASLDSPMSICIGDGKNDALYEFIDGERRNSTHASVPVDLYPDVLKIDKIFSDITCFFGVDKNGIIYTVADGRRISTGKSADKPLTELLHDLSKAQQ